MTHVPYAPEPDAAASARLAMLSALVAGDLHTAYRLALSLLDDGVPFERVVADVVAPVQGEVGRRWAAGDLSVAEEHAATAVVEDLVTMLASGLVEGDGPVVVVACPEGDDHALPARVVAAVLGLHGLRPTFLGASLPAADLRRFLTDRPAPVLALALSVSVPSALPAAARSIAAAHDAGVPVLAGGRALGSSAARAERLGGDGWAADAAGAVEHLDAWRRDAPSLRGPVPDSAEVARLARRRAALAGAVVDALVEGGGPYASLDDGRAARLGDEMPRLIQVLEASMLLEEPGVLHEYAAWLDARLEAHGYPTGMVPAALQALADACAQDLPAARAAVLAKSSTTP